MELFTLDHSCMLLGVMAISIMDQSLAPQTHAYIGRKEKKIPFQVDQRMNNLVPLRLHQDRVFFIMASSVSTF